MEPEYKCARGSQIVCLDERARTELPKVAQGTHTRSGQNDWKAISRCGMGEVYRARDTKLGRDIAIKVVSAPFSSDPERLARFEREARTSFICRYLTLAEKSGVRTSARY